MLLSLLIFYCISSRILPYASVSTSFLFYFLSAVPGSSLMLLLLSLLLLLLFFFSKVPAYPLMPLSLLLSLVFFSSLMFLVPSFAPVYSSLPLFFLSAVPGSLVLLLSLPCCSKVGQDAGDQLMCLHALLA
jgi:hypothetical protein